jgi:dipeptide/tripeptide permease
VGAFSYYGMRALLTLYMTSKLADGASALTKNTKRYLCDLCFVGGTCLVGGWLADKILAPARES